jgi:hypothetical protein
MVFIHKLLVYLGFLVFSSLIFVKPDGQYSDYAEY